MKKNKNVYTCGNCRHKFTTTADRYHVNCPNCRCYDNLIFEGWIEYDDNNNKTSYDSDGNIKEVK